MTAARLDHHVFVFLENDIRTLVKIQDGDSTELGGGATRLGHVVGSHEMDECLDNGVVGGVHVSVEREGALPVAVVGGVTVRSDDPVLPTKVFETHVQSSLLTSLPPVSPTEKVSVDVIIREVLLQVGILLFLSIVVRF